jgi:hypothetical protein
MTACNAPQRGYPNWSSALRKQSQTSHLAPWIPGRGLADKKLNQCKSTYLVLDQKLNTLDRSSCGLRDCGRDTTHCYRALVHVFIAYPYIHPNLSTTTAVDCDDFSMVDVVVNVLMKSITKGGL